MLIKIDKSINSYILYFYINKIWNIKKIKNKFFYQYLFITPSHNMERKSKINCIIVDRHTKFVNLLKTSKYKIDYKKLTKK